MSRRSPGAFVLALALAATLLVACGGEQDPDRGAAERGERAGDAALAAVARDFRRDGVLLGADALDGRFGRDGVRIATALAAPEDLPLFLAAALPVFSCAHDLAAIVYVSPIFRSLLVTRWSFRDGVVLESVHAVPALGGAATHWLDALPDVSSAAELLEARYAAGLRHVRDDELCARTRKPATQAAPLIGDDERSGDLDRVADPAESLGELQRALRALLAHGDAKALETLGFDASRDVLAKLPGARPAVYPVPVSARSRGAVSLLLYADLNVAGRYLLFGHVRGNGDGGRGDSVGGVELIALPLER